MMKESKCGKEGEGEDKWEGRTEEGREGDWKMYIEGNRERQRRRIMRG